jgi:adenine-specific DNA-methyltransferase
MQVGEKKYGSHTVYDIQYHIVWMIRYWHTVSSEKCLIILDYYSGFATTAHEEIKAEKTEYKNICAIGKERIHHTGEKIKEVAGLTAQNIDIGFRLLMLDDPNMKDALYAAGEYTQDLLIDNVRVI